RQIEYERDAQSERAEHRARRTKNAQPAGHSRGGADAGVDCGRRVVGQKPPQAATGGYRIQSAKPVDRADQLAPGAVSRWLSMVELLQSSARTGRSVAGRAIGSPDPIFARQRR